jgi:coproporphyrinogen III oxidase
MVCPSMQHRNERRGLGGIFFDDLNDYDQEMLLNFATGKSPY